MRRLFVLCLLPAALVAADHWTKFIAGPYQVFTDAGTGPGREALVRFEEFRHAVGEVVGEPNLQTQIPVRILLFKNAQGWSSAEPVSEGRASYNIVLERKRRHQGCRISRYLQRAHRASSSIQHCADAACIRARPYRILLDLHGEGHPHHGRSAAARSADLDWARIHMLVTDPDYFGKLRVLLFNLRRGAAEDPAYRNAFGKSAAEVEAQVKQRFAEHDIRTGTISSLPMAQRDFPEREVSDGDARLARADLLAGEKSAAEYEALIRDGLHTADAEEGLGPDCASRTSPGRSQNPFRRRNAGWFHQRPLLYRVRQARNR